jgi:aspartate ammonia-lyase
MTAENIRVETDALGVKEIPDDVYYGIQTLRASENFPITGEKIHRELIFSMAMVKKATALANMEIGRLDHKSAGAIIKAADEIIDGKWLDQFIVDPLQGGAGTSINMNMNEVIANRGLELLGKKKGEYYYLSPNSSVNMSQSTNDAFPTSIHIAVLSLLDKLLSTLNHMSAILSIKAEEFDNVIKMGRTHLQDAVPIRLGQELNAYHKVLERDIKRIETTKQHLFEVNIGATAIGTGLNANKKYITNVLFHLKDISKKPLVRSEDFIDATQNTDSYTEVSSSLKICMINMSKMANDLRLMSSGPCVGFNEINLPSLQPGSSIMPGKVNPVLPELINQTAFQVIGNDHTISLASEAGQFELNVMEPVLVFNLIQSIEIMTNTFNVFTERCLKDMTVNAKKLEQDVEKSIGIITAVSPHLSYETTAKIAREAADTGKSIKELCLKHNMLTEEELDVILDPVEMTRPGIAGESLLNKQIINMHKLSNSYLQR